MGSVEDEWPFWRLVTDHRVTATKTEIETQWWIEDVYDANQALDIQIEIEGLRRS